MTRQAREFEFPPLQKNFHPSFYGLSSPTPDDLWTFHCIIPLIFFEYVTMSGLQHLIDFILNEVALSGDQGVYSIFQPDPLSLT